MQLPELSNREDWVCNVSVGERHTLEAGFRYGHVSAAFAIGGELRAVAVSDLDGHAYAVDKEGGAWASSGFAVNLATECGDNRYTHRPVVCCDFGSQYFPNLMGYDGDRVELLTLSGPAAILRLVEGKVDVVVGGGLGIDAAPALVMADSIAAVVSCLSGDEPQNRPIPDKLWSSNSGVQYVVSSCVSAHEQILELIRK